MQRILFVAALAFLMLGLGLATFYSGRLLRRFIPPENVLLTLPDNLLRLFLILLCAGLGMLLAPAPDKLGWGVDRLPADLAAGVAAAALLSPALTWVGKAVVRRWGPDVYDNRLLRAIVPVNREEWVGVAAALLPAALLEEMLFRSLPLGGLSWAVSPWVLMWPLSLLFGLMHVTQGEWGVMGTALMGLVLSALFLSTGSIWPAVIAHWLLNVIEVTLAQHEGLRPLRADRDAVS